MVFHSLRTSIQSPNSLEIQRKLDSLYFLLKNRTSKGIVNLDSNLNRNFGFIGDQAIEIDFGAYVLCSKEDAEKDFSRFFISVYKWLYKRSPEWASYWEELKNEK